MDAKLASVLRQIEQGAVVVDPETMRVTASELRRVCTLLEEAKHAPEMLSRSRIRDAVVGAASHTLISTSNYLAEIAESATVKAALQAHEAEQSAVDQVKP